MDICVNGCLGGEDNPRTVSGHREDKEVQERKEGMRGWPLQGYIGLFRGLYWGYIGIMEKKMETTIISTHALVADLGCEVWHVIAFTVEHLGFMAAGSEK